MQRTDRDFVLSNLTKFVEEEGFGDSTWTIDLCYILKRFNVLFRYTTITIGVDPGYSKEAFYDKVLHPKEVQCPLPIHHYYNWRG